MPHFRYTAQDVSGQIVEGRLEAGDQPEARRQLTERGLTRLRLTDLPAGAVLTEDESHDLALTVAELAQSDLPLARGFRAAAQEASSRRLARVFLELAERIESGRSLDGALIRLEDHVPPHLVGLISAGARSGKLAVVLNEIVRSRTATRGIWNDVLLGASYPTLTLAVGLFLVALLGIVIIGPFEAIIVDFGIRTTLLTNLLLLWHRVLAWGVLAALLMLTGFFVLAPWISSTSRYRRILAVLPLFGILLHWGGVVEMCRLLSLLLSTDIPLPEALRLTGDGIRDAHLSDVCRAMAREAEQGRPLSTLMRDSGQLPYSIVPLVQWGERQGQLPEALIAAAELFERRMKIRAEMLRTVYPPIPFLLIGGLVVMGIIGLLMPLLQVIRQI